MFRTVNKIIKPCTKYLHIPRNINNTVLSEDCLKFIDNLNNLCISDYNRCYDP